MDFSEWVKKKKEEEEESSKSSQTTVSSTHSQSSSTSDPESTGSTDTTVSFSDWVRNKKATSSAQGWADASINLLTDIEKRSEGWYNQEEYESQYSKISDLLSKADSWRKEYAGNDEAISYINSVVDALSDAQTLSSNRRNFYSMWDTAEDYNAALKDYSWRQEYNGKTYNDIQSILADMEDGEEKEWLTAYAPTAMTYEEAIAKRDAAPNNDDYLFYHDLANQKLIAKHAETLSKTAMEGTNKSVLDEMLAVAKLPDGDEKDTRKKTVINKMAEVGVDPDIYYSLITGDSNVTFGGVLDWAGGSFGAGWASFNKGITGTLDLILGRPLQSLGWENNPISSMADTYNDEYNRRKYDAELYSARMGGGEALSIGGQVIEATAAAAPDAIAAVLTAGYSKASSIANAGVQASSNFLAKAGLTAQQMMKNPSFWLSYARTFSSDYEEAKALGADDITAAFGATLTSLINAGIEIGFTGGSGIQGLHQNVAEGGNKAIVAWAKSAAEEGGEEVLQGFVNNAVSKLLYDSDTELASLEDMMMEFAMGAAVGGILGGGQTALTSTVNAGVNAYKGYRYNKQNGKIYGSSAENIQALIAEGLESPEGSLSRTLATQYQQKLDSGKTLSGKEISKLFEANDQAIRVEETSEMKTATEAKLRELGETGDVSAIADVIVKKAYGEPITTQERAILNNSQYASDLVSVVASDKQLTRVNIGKYDDALMNLAQEVASGKVDTDVSKTRMGNVTTVAENASQVNHKVSEDGKMVNTITGDVIEPQGLVQAEDGTYKIAAKDADPVSSADVSYADSNQALVYETFVNLEQHSGKTSKVIADMDLTSRNELLGLYNPAMNTDGGTFVNGVLDAYFFGHRNVDLSAISKDSPVMALTEQQRKIAWNTGRKAGIKSDTAVQSNLDTVYAEAKKVLEQTGKSKNGNYRAVLADGIVAEDMSDAQYATYQLADKVAQAVQTKIRVYKGKNKAQGFYNHATDEIWLNLNAANRGREAIMAFTLAHELVHRAKKGSHARYQAFVDFLMKEYGKQGSNVEAMIAEQIRAAEEFNKTVPNDQKVNMTREKALEEVVCDACQRMFLDTNAGEKLAEFGAQSKQNKGFLADLKKWISELMTKLRRYFGNIDPDSLAAKEFAKFDAKVKQMFADMYVDMSIEAGEKLSTIKAAFGSEFAQKFQGLKDIRYNLAAVDTHKAKLQKEYSEDSSTDLGTIMKRYDKILDIWTKLGGELNSKFLADWNSKVGKDRSFTIFKAQAGYKYNVELSSMCKKGVPLFEAIDTIVKQEVMKELNTDILGKAEKEILYDILKQHNFEIPCAICYVEQARQREGVIIDAFLNGKVETNSKGQTTKVKLGWNQVLESIEKEMKANGVDYHFAQVSRDIATEKYTPADLSMDSKTQDAFYSALKKIANQEITRYNKAEGKSRKLLSDVTPEAVKECFKGTLPANLNIFKVMFNESESLFKIQNDLLYSSIATQNLSMAHNKLYGLFNMQGGVSGYKTKQGTTIYWGDILGKSWKPDTLRNEGGVRNQSNSDFQMYTLLDQAQMYLDFTAKGYYLQAYTKVLSELKLFGLSRGKINASLIPKVVVYRNADGSVDIEKTMDNAGLDENGDPIYDDIEGINHNEAFMLIEDPEYSKSICGICIGYSDAHIEKLLDDNRVQQIIGFHDKTDDGSKRYKGARYAKNYNGLNEAVNKEGKTVHIGFNPYVKKAEKKFKFNAETETYEGTINYNGKTYTADDIPRLAADLYLEMCAKKEYTPAYKKFAGHRNYYKLLADFGLYDSQGHYAPHRKVAYNMPDTVPYLDADGKKQTMKTYDYIKAELTKELAVRDSISEALADTSSEGIIPQFKEAVKKRQQEEKSYSLTKANTLTQNSLAAIEKFGTTSNFGQAGFTIADGRMLNLSRYGQTGVQHRIIEGIFDDIKGKAAVVKFIQEGNVRINAGSPGIEIGTEVAPTVSQLNTISRFINDSIAKKGIFYLDITDSNGDNVATVEYDDRSNASDILYDIKSYYERGRVPNNPSRSEWFYSLPKTDTDGNNLSEDQLEFFEESKVRDAQGRLKVLYHGSRSEAFTEFDISQGVWLTPDHRYAEVYAEQWHSWRDDMGGAKRDDINGLEPSVYSDPDYRLYKMYANIKNPADIGELNQDLTNTVIRNLAKALGVEYSRVKDIAAEYEGQWTYEMTRSEEFIELAHQQGFDGFKATENGKETWCAFSAPNQVKLTTNEVPSSFHDIRYSLPKADSAAYQESAYQEWDVQVALYDALDHADTGDDNLIKVGNMPRYITEKLGIDGDFYIYRNHAYENMVSREKAIEEGRPVKRKGEAIRFHNLGIDTMTEAVMALENPIMTIATKTKERNPAVIMILPVKGKNNAPLYSVLSFYSNRYINGDYSRKPHIVLTIAEREFFGSKGRGGYADIIGQAIKDGRVIDFNKEMRDELSVIANPAGVGNITDSSLANNLSYFLKEIKSFREKNHIDYKLPIGEDTSPRALLANAFEGIITDDIEKRKIQEYKGKVEMLNAEEQKLHELRAEIKELSFAKGKRDTKRIKGLQFDAIQTANRIATLDKILLRLESAAPLQNILKREKEMAYKRAEQKGKEALEAYREAERERDKQWQSEVKEKYQASKKKAIETRDKREAREKLQKVVLDTVKWITYPSKTDVKCPDILKQPYADFLNGIDLSSHRLAKGGDPTQNDLRLTNAMSSLATALDKIMVSQDPSSDPNSATSPVLDSGYLDLPANYVETLRDMTEKIKETMGTNEYVVNKMPAEDVRKLTQMIRTLNHAIKEVSTLYANLRFANVEALGDNTMSFVDALGEIDKTGGVKDFVQWDNALPYYAFKRFGEGGESIFEGLMDAQDKLAFLAQDIFNFREKAWTSKEAKAWSEDTHKIDLPNGTSLTLTTADAMSIYCLSRRQQGLQHLLGGGTRVIGIQKGSQKAKDSRSLLTIKDIETIISSLTDRQKQVADAIQEFMSTTCSEWGNEISMKRFLTKEFNEKFYFPIESNDENLATKDPSAQQSDLFRLLNISATKPIDPRANNEVIIRNIFDVFTGHAADMARLNAFGMPLLDYMKWLNYREKTVNEEGQNKVRGVRKSMEMAYGNAAKSYVLNLVKDVNGRASDGGDPTILMKWMRAAKTASVGSSLRVATLQITSYPRASLVLSPKNLALGLSKMPQIGKAKKYCGIALWKSFGFYDTNISRSIEDQIKGVTDVKQKLIELSLKGAEWGDAITWGALWNACEYEVAATKKYKVGTEEFNQAVAKKLREVVYATQVVDSTLTRSQMMRSKRGLAQEAAAFMSEPTVSANILMDAGFRFNAEKRKTGSAKTAWQKTGKYIGRAVAVYSIGQLAAALLEGFWDAWRDDDDEEFGEKYLNAFVENLALDIIPFNKIPIVSDVFEAGLSMFDVGFYSSDKMSTTWLTQAVSAVDAWKEVLNGGSSMTAYNALYKSLRAVSSFYGVAFSGVMREGVALWNNTAGAYDSTLKIRTWDLSKSDLAGEALDAILEGNDRQASSIRAEFSDDDSYRSAMRTAIKDRYTSGEIDYDTAIQYLVEYGGMEEEDAYWKAEEWMYESETGEDFGKYNEFFTAVQTGKNLKSVIKKYTNNGVELTTLSTQISNYFKPLYIEMTRYEKAGIKGYLLNAFEQCGVKREDANKKLQYWEFLSEQPDTDLTQYQIADYYEFAKPAGISAAVYSSYCAKVDGIEGEDKKERRMAVINSLPLSSAQKDALYFAEGWAKSKLNEAPWH